MQTVSNNYQTIVSGDHWFQSRLVIQDPNTWANIGIYDEDKLFSMSTSLELLKETFSIGGAPSAECDIVMVEPTVEIPPMSRLCLYTRARNDTLTSEWLLQGIFFIDTRKHTITQSGEKILTIHGYDAMLKAERMHTKAITQKDADLIKSIARAIGVRNANGTERVDPRTWNIVPQAGQYSFSVTPSYAMRDTLRNIASAYGGWFIVTDNYYLRLLSVSEFPPETNLLTDEDYDRLVFGTGANATRILV